MLDLLGMIGALDRPRLLVEAARLGVDGYRRAAHLPRLLRCAGLPSVGEAILGLLDLEADLEVRRVARSAEYSVARHVAALAALLGEARAIRAGSRPRLPEAA